MIEVHMPQQTQGPREDVAIIFSMEQLGRLKDTINSTYIDAQEKGLKPHETRYLKVTGVVKRP